jgi:hypothetical protein
VQAACFPDAGSAPRRRTTFSQMADASADAARPPDRSLDVARRAGHLGAPALSGHRRNYRQRGADLWCRYKRPSICRDWLIRITARSREGGTSRAKPGFMGRVGGCPRNPAGLPHAVLSDVPRVSGPASAIVDGSELSWRRLPPEAKAVIPQSGPSLTRGIVEIQKIATKNYLLIGITRTNIQL